MWVPARKSAQIISRQYPRDFSDPSMRAAVSTAQQLLGRNVSEAIVQKDDHARDACKYVVLSHPEPTLKSVRELIREHVLPLAEIGDLTSAYIRAAGGSSPLAAP